MLDILRLATENKDELKKLAAETARLRMRIADLERENEWLKNEDVESAWVISRLQGGAELQALLKRHNQAILHIHKLKQALEIAKTNHDPLVRDAKIKEIMGENWNN